MTSILARMPTGMGSIALILYVHETAGSFASAGIVAAAFSIGRGATGPFLARLIDRRGTRRILIPAALVSSLALAAVAILGELGAGVAPLVLVAALAGAANPPFTGLLRRRWPSLVEGDELPTAYAIDAILIEVAFITGPLLAGILAATEGAASALYAAAALGTLGALLFAPLAGVEQAKEGTTSGHWLGALTSPTVRLLVISGIPLAATFGALEVTLPAFGAQHGAAALGGPFTAALAFGSMLGGLSYGARPQSLGRPSRALLLLGGLMIATCLPLPFAVSITEMLVFAVIAGLCVAPVGTVQSRLIHSNVSTEMATEAFSWMPLTSALGLSIGSALAGPIVAGNGWRAGAVVACVLAAIGVSVAVLGRQALAFPAKRPVTH